MAWTVSRHKTIYGNHAVVGLNLTADAATQTVETGLKNINFISVAYKSMGTVVGLNIAVNSNASGVQSYGVIGLSGFTSGDALDVVVYGTR